jgi:hypothetical protein
MSDNRSGWKKSFAQAGVEAVEDVRDVEPEIDNQGREPLESGDAPPNWVRVIELLSKNYDNPDLIAARAICSAVAAHKLRSFSPVWTLAIAPPGSMKTDLLESLRGLPKVHFVDEITPKTFISGKVDEPGKKRERPASYLHRIGEDGILIAADFSTFTADQKALTIVLAQLRRIYDGNYSREFGTDENTEERSWKGRLTLLAGAVPDIDRHHELFQKLGERFVRIRWPRAGGVAAGLRAMDHTDALAPKLRGAMHTLLRPILETSKIIAPRLDRTMQVRIASLSEIIALARSHVERDRYSREVLNVPITEGNTRIAQQLCQVARGSALVDGRAKIDESDFKLARRVGFDSLPLVRRAVLEALIAGTDLRFPDLPATTVKRSVEDLQLVGLLTKGDRPSSPTVHLG